MRSLQCSPLVEMSTGRPRGTGLLHVPGGGGGGGFVGGTCANVAVMVFGAFIVTITVDAFPVTLPCHEDSFASMFGDAVSLTRLPARYTRLQMRTRVR